VNLNLSEHEIERIVQEVVKRLVRLAPTQSANDAGKVQLTDRVITLASLDGKLDERTTVVCVPTKAVVTPAVRDELRTKKIELRREDCQAAVPNKIRIVNASKLMLSGGWANSTSVETVGDIRRAIQKATQIAKSDGMTVLVTQQSDAAAIAANRTSGVQAIVARSIESIGEVIQSTGANLIVCDANTFADSEIPRLIATITGLRRLTKPSWIA